MKNIGLAVVLVGLATAPALAQQQPPGDPALNACQQLLTGANNNLIQVAAQATMLSRQLEDAKAELTKLKAPPPEEKK